MSNTSFLHRPSLQYFETSAADGQNVAESVEALLDMVMSHVDDDEAKLATALALNNRVALDEVDEASADDGKRCFC